MSLSIRATKQVAVNMPLQRYEVRITENRHEIEEAQRLRYEVFAREMGARLKSDHLGLDQDRYDHFVKHLIVRDAFQRKIVGYTRILTREMASVIGGFYSCSEFDLSRILALPGKMIEIGRTCIHKDYRKGSTISLLWTGIATVMENYKIDYLIGCASIPMGEHGEIAKSVLRSLNEHRKVPEAIRVFPKTPLPKNVDHLNSPEATIPPLIKGYLRAGATICGEPCWDPEFNVADLFIFLDRKKIDSRYQKHFLMLGRKATQGMKKAG